jgi:hypothetical protein
MLSRLFGVSSIVVLAASAAAAAACGAGSKSEFNDDDNGRSSANGAGGGDFSPTGGNNQGGAAECAEVNVEANPAPLDMIVLLDRSGSMDSTRWGSAVNALTAFFNDPNSATMTVGLDMFPPISGDTCAATSYNPLHVGFGQLGTGHSSALLNHMSNNDPFDGGNGNTPTYGGLQGALQVATAHKDANPDHAVVVVMASDGEPSECDTSLTSISNLTASAYNYNGVRTYALGITGATLANLQTMVAYAGGAAIDVQSNAQLFIDAMNEIRDAFACTLNMPPNNGDYDPQRVNVKFTPEGGSPETWPQVAGEADCPSGGNAWYYDDPVNPTQITLCPAACDTVNAAAEQSGGGELNVWLGCPTHTQ